MFFFSFFFLLWWRKGGGWSSSRWLFGTQLGLGSRSGLAVAQRCCGGRALQSHPTTTALATVVSGMALKARLSLSPLKKTGKNLHKFNQNQALKSILK